MIEMSGAVNLVGLVVPLVFAGLWWLERRHAAQPFVEVEGWSRRGVSFFVATAAVGSVVPWLWRASPLEGVSVLHLRSWGYAGVPLGLLFVTFVSYWWHRAEHRTKALWLATHQLHHSALRIDVAGAYYVHPLEVAAKGTLAFLALSVVLGLTVQAATVASTATAVISIFQHWNVRTPRMLGYVLPRPEMHQLHHEYGVHGRNYGDLPLWDMLFGTYANPAEVPAGLRVGFDAQASAAPHGGAGQRSSCGSGQRNGLFSAFTLLKKV